MLVAAVAILCSIITLFVLESQRELKAKETGTQLRQLSYYAMEVSETQPCDISCLKRVLAEHGRDEILIDSWGNPILLELKSRDGQVVYHFRSFGSDGKKGRCCDKFVDSYAEDAVIENGEWLQIWR